MTLDLNRRPPRRRASALRNRAGTAAVEFAVIAPLMLLILAALANIGSELYVRFKLDSAVAAATNYAIVNVSSVNSAGAASLAGSLANIVSQSEGSGWANSSVTVNDGSSATITSGQGSTGGTASNADSCYCPTGSAASVVWGAAQTCGATCPNGGYAGKFVAVAASRIYSSPLPSFGIIQNGSIASSSIVQVQ